MERRLFVANTTSHVTSWLLEGLSMCAHAQASIQVMFTTQSD